jgi:hypothetical protein
MKHVRTSAIAASAFACAALFSFSWSEQSGVSISVESAQARVGRPLTPMSGAGVARRQARRGAYGVGVAGAAAVGTAAAIGTAAAVASGPYYGTQGYYAGGPYYQGTGYYGGRPYYQGAGYYTGGPFAAYGWSGQDYATRNGFTCTPGSMTKLDDGHMYRCQ